MLRLIWIFRFVAGRCLDGRRLGAGGMALSAKMWLRFGNVMPNLEFENVSEDFVRAYFGLNDDLAGNQPVHRQRRLHHDWLYVGLRDYASFGRCHGNASSASSVQPTKA